MSNTDMFSDFEHYSLKYELGQHHIDISVDKHDFFKVIDDLSMEFTIYKTHYLDRNNDPNESGFNTVDVDYSIINYWGDNQIIGYASKRV